MVVVTGESAGDDSDIFGEDSDSDSAVKVLDVDSDIFKVHYIN